MYSYGPPHMAEQKQDDQLKHTYSSYVRIRDVALKTCQRRWMIGRSGERGPGISVLAARHDDDDVKLKIDKTQQNSRCRLYDDRDETINHMINECSTLAQKEYKTRYDLIGNVIHWELCKKFKFDHTIKWYMYNPENLELDALSSLGFWDTDRSLNLD